MPQSLIADMVVENALDPIDLLLSAFAQGDRCAVATLVAVDGSSPRAVGAQLALCIFPDGSQKHSGTLSGGCLDEAVLQELQRAIESRSNFRIRFGKDSPYIDITLPCGSGVDVQFAADFSDVLIADLAHCWRSRLGHTWRWASESHQTECVRANAVKNTPPELTNSAARWVYKAPPLRLLLAGRGANLQSASRIAQAADIEAIAMSPDREALASLSLPEKAKHLLQPAEISHVMQTLVDEHTAVLVMFHEHELETELLIQALRSRAFWVGAMGSERAHQARLKSLQACGVSADQCAALRGPVGVVQRTRTPQEFALSALAEISSAYRLVVDDAAKQITA